MKLLFGVDVTDPAHHKEVCSALCTRELSGPLQAQYDALEAAEAEYGRLSSLPKWLLYVKKLIGYASAVFLLSFISSAFEQNPNTNHRIVSLDELLGIILLLVWIALTCFDLQKTKDVITSDEFLASKRQAADLEQAARLDLGVPEDAAEMDVLCSRYRWKYGEMVCADSSIIWYYGNISMHAWQENGCFCLADLTMRFDIPLSDIRTIERVKKGYDFSAWNKPEPYKAEKYKPYRVHVVNGNLSVYGYISMVVLLQEEDYEIRLPVWEADTLSRLTCWSF